MFAFESQVYSFGYEQLASVLLVSLSSLEMKVKNSWHRPQIIVVTALIAVGIIIMVAIAVVQHKPLNQKYKV